MADITSGMYTLCAIEEGADAQPRPQLPVAGSPVCPGGSSCRRRARRRRRTWYLSPDGFRELRHSCFLSRQACAAFLGVSLRTVRYWDAGRSRVPWSVVRLLRLFRAGDVGGLNDAWAGWYLNPRTGELVSPNGYSFQPGSLAAWSLTCEQARFWRRDYDRRVELGRMPERLEGASPGAPSTWVADALYSPPLVVSDPSATPLPRQTALFVLPVAAASLDAAVVRAAAESLPVLPNAGVFLADPGMLAAQLPLLAQGQSLPFGSSLTPLCYHSGDFVTVPPSPNGPASNTGLNPETGS
jgi:hypothetical protein